MKRNIINKCQCQMLHVHVFKYSSTSGDHFAKIGHKNKTCENKV